MGAMDIEMLVLKQVTKQYQIKPAALSVLHGIDLSVSRGQIVGLIGKSGAGKSTLVRCMNLLERPSSGQVIFNDVDLMTLSDAKLRQQRHKIGMIFQHFNLLSSCNVFDNVALPLSLQGRTRQQIQKTVMPLLELVGLDDRKAYFPHQLSGGQKQRVAIARALATKPQLLLSDEATSALDPESTQRVLDLLKQINQEMGLTIVLITHAMNVIKKICDEVGIVDAGRLIEFGKVIDVFADPKQAVTQRLVGQAVHCELPEGLQQRVASVAKPGLHPLVKLTFTHQSANAPLTNTIHDRFGVMVNIMQADLEYIHGNNLGFMICQMQGDAVAVDQALSYLQTQSVISKVLGYV